MPGVFALSGVCYGPDHMPTITSGYVGLLSVLVRRLRFLRRPHPPYHTEVVGGMDIAREAM